MGVLTKSGSTLHRTGGRPRPERGVAVLMEVSEAADVISEGKLLVRGVATSSLGLGPGILKAKRGFGRLNSGAQTAGGTKTGKRRKRVSKSLRVQHQADGETSGARK